MEVEKVTKKLVYRTIKVKEIQVTYGIFWDILKIRERKENKGLL